MWKRLPFPLWMNAWYWEGSGPKNTAPPDFGVEENKPSRSYMISFYNMMKPTHGHLGGSLNDMLRSLGYHEESASPVSPSHPAPGRLPVAAASSPIHTPPSISIATTTTPNISFATPVPTAKPPTPSLSSSSPVPHGSKPVPRVLNSKLRANAPVFVPRLNPNAPEFVPLSERNRRALAARVKAELPGLRAIAEMDVYSIDKHSQSKAYSWLQPLRAIVRRFGVRPIVDVTKDGKWLDVNKDGRWLDEAQKLAGLINGLKKDAKYIPEKVYDTSWKKSEFSDILQVDSHGMVVGATLKLRDHMDRPVRKRLTVSKARHMWDFMDAETQEPVNSLIRRGAALSTVEADIRELGLDYLRRYNSSSHKEKYEYTTKQGRKYTINKTTSEYPHTFPSGGDDVVAMNMNEYNLAYRAKQLLHVADRDMIDRASEAIKTSGMSSHAIGVFVEKLNRVGAQPRIIKTFADAHQLRVAPPVRLPPREGRKIKKYNRKEGGKKFVLDKDIPWTAKS
jgi:hypothetical protein